MKSLFFSLGVLALTTGFGVPAQAQNYPWCATYSGGMGGGQNCGFTTFEQCMATVRGMGGFCNQNSQCVAPAGPARRR